MENIYPTDLIKGNTLKSDSKINSIVGKGKVNLFYIHLSPHLASASAFSTPHIVGGLLRYISGFLPIIAGSARP